MTPEGVTTGSRAMGSGGPTAKSVSAPTRPKKSVGAAEATTAAAMQGAPTEDAAQELEVVRRQMKFMQEKMAALEKDQADWLGGVPAAKD